MNNRTTDILARFRHDLAANKVKSAALGALVIVLLIVVGRLALGGKETSSVKADSLIPAQPSVVSAAPTPSAPVPGPVNGSPTRSSGANPDQVPMGADAAESKPPVRVDRFPRTISRDPFRNRTWLTKLAADEDEEAAARGPGLFERLVRTWSDMQSKQRIIENDIEKRLDRMKLQSTLIGSVNSAYISGRLVHPGDVIEGFSVVRIEPKRVTLRYSGIERVLYIP